MAERISVQDVRNAWVNYCDAAKYAGFDVTGWEMREGTRSMGVHYDGRTGDGKPVPGAVSQGMNAAYLGSTRAETYQALRHMTNVFRAVAERHPHYAERTSE